MTIANLCEIFKIEIIATDKKIDLQLIRKKCKRWRKWRNMQTIENLLFQNLMRNLEWKKSKIRIFECNEIINANVWIFATLNRLYNETNNFVMLIKSTQQRLTHWYLRTCDNWCVHCIQQNVYAINLLWKCFVIEYSSSLFLVSSQFRFETTNSLLLLNDTINDRNDLFVNVNAKTKKKSKKKRKNMKMKKKISSQTWNILYNNLIDFSNKFLLKTMRIDFANMYWFTLFDFEFFEFWLIDDFWLIANRK